MFKKRERKGSKRAREPAAASADEPAHATIVAKERKQTRGAHFGTRGDDDGDSDDDDRMQGAAVFASSATSRPSSTAAAFAHQDFDTDKDQDARALLRRKFELQEAGATNDETGLYQGQAGYKSYVKLNEAQIGANKYTGTKGPIRAPSFVRNTCRFDYQPDLEAEYQRQKERDKEREMLGKLGEPDSDDEREANKFRVGAGAEELPFACHLCRGPFKDPMMTTCGHYYCASCASSHFREKNTRCPICEKQTYGMLNAAPKLRAKAKARAASTLFKSLVVDEEEDVDDYKGAGDYGAPDQAPGAARPTPEPPRAAPAGSWQSVDPRNL
ncbi:hypothetical protein JL720_12871 [Aureococcus anophagefferens]|nr:hypothetical protein JL720_12871 [Aureococcus anophagefferens]